jgi:hypothetical protein
MMMMMMMMMMNNELKDEVVAYFKIRYRNLRGRSEETHANLRIPGVPA